MRRQGASGKAEVLQFAVMKFVIQLSQILTICVENGTISFLDEELLNYYFKNPNGDCRKLIDVSDIMEDKEETEILDKLEDLKRIENEFKNLVEQEEETDAREKLDAINTQINKQIEDLRKQGKEPKAIEYTIKVCFE